MSTDTNTPLSIGEVAQRIIVIRGQRVLLDADLAAFYGETTKRFNQQVRRNLARFPADFMFPLNAEEFAALRLQSATLKSGRGQHRKYLPLAFNEHGAIMAATLLNSPRATELSVYVVRAFVELTDSMGQLLATPAPPPKRPIEFLPLEDKKNQAAGKTASTVARRSKRDR